MNTLHLAWLDIKKLLRSRFLRLAGIGVTLMPLLYSFLYLSAFWDPYGKLNEIPVAFVNEDRGGTLNGQTENFGQELLDKLKENHDLKWSFVSRTDADAGLKSGRYYMALIVPEDFTAKVLTATEAHPQKAELVYIANQSNNFLASGVGKRAIQEVQSQLSAEISGKFFENLLVGLKDGASGLKDAADGAAKLADGSSQALIGAQSVTDGAAKLKDGAVALQSGAAAAADGAGKLAAGVDQAGQKLAAAGQGAAQLSAGLKSAAQAGAQLGAGLDQLAAGLQKFAGGVAQLNGGIAQFQAGLADPAKGLPALTAGMAQLQAGAGQSAQALAGAQALLKQYAHANPAAAQDPAFQKALAMVGGAQQGLQAQLVPGMKQVAGGLDQLKTVSDATLTRLAAGSGALQTNVTALSQGIAQANGGAKQLAGGLSQLQTGAAQLAAGLNDPTGMRQLKGGADSLAAGLAQLQDGSVRLTAGLTDLHAGAGQLASGIAQVKDGNATLASKLADAAKTSAEGAEGDPAERSKVMGAPVALSDRSIFPVAQYGVGFTPYFVPLALWVGAMMLFFVVRTRENRVKTSPVPAPVAVLAKFLTFGFFGAVQAVVTSFVLLTFLPLHPTSVLGFYAFNILISLADVAIIQLLATLMGIVGRFLAIVLLMFQLTSCAGTFPLEMLPKFFQSLNPFMPMTYATGALRYLVSGSSPLKPTTCVLTVAGFLVGALTLTMLSESRFVAIRDLHPSTELAG